MFLRQSDPNANDHARQKTDEKTKPGRVAHRALTQVENPRRFIFVHFGILSRAGQSASDRDFWKRLLSLRVAREIATPSAMPRIWN